MRPVTPAAFLVEVNTLKTLPLLYGIVDEQTLRQRIDEALGFADAAVTGTGSSMKVSPEFSH
ncbi:conjugal transfer protein TrbB [Escherichia coli]|nr:conjugal transfer protein TrbB [Escherichia coli]